MSHALYLAPIRGVTDAIYRNSFFEHFGGFDLAMAPFVTTPRGKRIKPNHIKDLLPERNRAFPMVPQLLSKEPEQFVLVARRLFDLGYGEINWNLGCPYPQVANKGRGSGLLNQPEVIDRFLDQVLPVLSGKLSVKTRLGRESRDEIFTLMPIFNRYPLSELIIHPRTGRQLYEGTVDRDTFEQCLDLSDHPVVYNGDITTVDEFQAGSGRFKGVNRWMIGRGALVDPFLMAAIKNGEVPETEKADRVRRFHDDLFLQYSEVLFGPSHLLDRMKGLWKYLGAGFKDSRNVLKRIHKTTKIDQYKEVVSRFFNEEAAWKPSPAGSVP